MQANKNDQIDECFVDHDTEQTHLFQAEQIKIDITPHFHKQLPANELRTARRPENLAARTFFLERPLYRLKDVLNRPCVQERISAEEAAQGKLKLKLANSQNLPLDQYFLKSKFKCIYNKLQTYRADSKSFQGRYKGVDSLIDYNWKCYKELEEQQKTPFTINADNVDSDFECGNICRAYVSSEEESEYYLLVQNDLNTYGYNNWFFYRFRNRSKGVRRFVIVNLIKKSNFFNQGMKISVFSTRKERYESRTWFKAGTKITYGSTNFIRNNHAKDLYYSLSFEYEFQHENDQVYFALNQPYSYSRLTTFISQAQNRSKNIQMQVKTVGYSISNNIIPAIRFAKNEETKQIILVLARQHPCETVGSFIAQKIMKNLIQQEQIGSLLMKEFQFIIVPMVNPDGVIHGVSRCNMAGLDLNRQWGENVVKQLAPETIKIKQFISNLSKTKKIKYMIDLHGHGKKLNSFFFCCKNSEKEDIRLLSMSMMKIEPRFDFQSCTYGVTKDKENTIRSQLNSMGVVHSCTLETSLFGWKNQEGQIRHYNQEDYQSIARSVVRSIFLIEAEPLMAFERIGFSKQEIALQVSRYVERITSEQEQNYDYNEILSESDPQGDKLDVKVLLGNCQNKALKKRMEEQYENLKRPKTKRSKKLHKIETIEKLSSNNTKEYYPSQLNLKRKLKIAANTAKHKVPFLRSDLKSRNISQTQKLKEKKVEKKISEPLFDQEIRNYSRIERRSRIKTQVEQRVKKALLPYSSFAKKHPNVIQQKIKTQSKEPQIPYFASEQELAQNNRKSALQMRFKQLRQESLNVLLTDTLSIAKINPNELGRLLSPEVRQSRNYSVKTKKQHLLTQPRKLQHFAKIATLDNTAPSKESVRYKKFKQFLYNGTSAKKIEKITNSVFYYFPVL